MCLKKKKGVTEGIQVRCASNKRKEDQSSPNSRKKQKTSVSQGSQGQGYGHQGQGQDRLYKGGEHFGALNQSEQGAGHHCHQFGHFQRDCPWRQESHGYGTPQSQSSARRVRVAFQDGRMVWYHCQQPGHMRRDCPQRKGSRGFGTA